MFNFLNFLKKLTATVHASSKVDGFTATLEKKSGVRLISKPDTPDAQAKPASVGDYYEVTVCVTGKNPEYPAEEKPCKFLYTVLLPEDSGYGFTGGTHFIPSTYRWIRFEIVEEFEDGRNTMGRRMPPHHGVVLRAYYLDENRKEHSMASGPGWVRQSERNTRQWEDALHSNVIWF